MPVADCHFCRLGAALSEQPGADLVWRFPKSIAILGTWQFYRGYCVLFAREHATELSQLDDTTRHAYFDEMCLLARVIERVSRPRKLNYEMLGNQVPHLHWHIFPRSADDPDMLKAVWLALDRAERDPDCRKVMQGAVSERAATIEQIRHELTALGAPSS